MNKNFVGRDGNAIVLVPGSLAVPEDTAVTTKKLRKLSTSQALPSELNAEARAEQSETGAASSAKQAPHKVMASSSQAMLSFLGTRAADANSSSQTAASARSHLSEDPLKDGRASIPKTPILPAVGRKVSGAFPPAGAHVACPPAGRGKLHAHGFWSARSQTTPHTLATPKARENAVSLASSRFCPSSNVPEAPRPASARYVSLYVRGLSLCRALCVELLSLCLSFSN
jgi:hypothetical protein